MSTESNQEMETATCPCGGGPTVDACCGPYLSGARKAPSAEALMRARYSAYVLEDVDFIGTSNHPDTQDDVDLESARRWAKAADWQGLEIVGTGDGPGEDEAWVEFVARYDIGHDKHSHHEQARFKRHEGGWAYLDGDLIKPRPIVREGPRIGRNDPCTCGSGKKYKKCHGA